MGVRFRVRVEWGEVGSGWRCGEMNNYFSKLKFLLREIFGLKI